MKVAVVGGGISGLATAWALTSRPGTEVTVFEPGRLGGKLLTSEFAGRPVDEGPDAFLVRTPEATDLCGELGLDDLVAPAAGRTLLWAGGRLRPLPEGLVLGVPGRLWPVIRSGLLSPAGILRAGLDLVLPRTELGDDISVGSLVGGRFGRQVADRLVEPLLGGIHAAPLGELSTALVAPHVLAAARSSRSLLLGLRRSSGPAPTPSGPIFLAPREGVGALAGALETQLKARAVQFRDDRVSAAEVTGAGVALSSGGDARDPFDAVVLALPAPHAAGILGPLAPGGLAAIPFTSVAVLAVAVPRSQWSPPPGFNGFLVPAGAGRLMTAGSFYSNKWPGGSGAVTVLRLSAGRHGDRRVDELGDEALTAALIGELGEAVGRTIRPEQTRLSRWPSSFPLYRVGHESEVRRMHRELAAATAGRIALAGSSYGGAGIPACIRSARAAARAVLPADQAGV